MIIELHFLKSQIKYKHIYKALAVHPLDIDPPEFLNQCLQLL